ncbi:MAG TPA: GNAT family N-acetyltransferase [Vineibacter sp.]|nr:GNAT family N-acetyltransferase [Vineibacter sp.]
MALTNALHAPEPHFDLFTKRVDALYRVDGNGRLVSTNEWDSRPAPRFHLMRTAEGPIFRCRFDVPDAVVHRLAALVGQEMPDRAFDKLPVGADRYLKVLGDHAPVERTWSGPAYVAGGDVSPNTTPTLVNAGNADVLRRRFEDWTPDVPHRQPFMAVLHDGEAVSICASVRISAAVHCAGVETHHDYRQRGHAADVVAGWVRAVRTLGAIPFYSTSWENAASQRVANRVGFVMAGVDYHVT